MSDKKRVEKGLSSTDNEYLREPEPESESEKAEKPPSGMEGDSIVLNISDNRVVMKKVGWKSGSEWKCPFCSNSENTQRQMQCRTCGAYRHQYGNMDMVYKGPTKRKVASRTLEMLRDAYVRYYGQSTV